VTPDPNRSAAVLIGPGRYDDDDLEDLPAAAWSAKSLAHLLTSPRFHLPRGAVELIGSDDDRTASQLRRHLSEFALEPRDTTIIYYAGHGKPDERRAGLRLALSSTEYSDPRESWVLFSPLWEDLLKATTRVKVVILDCCFGGVALDSASPFPVAPFEARTAGTFLVASASAYEPAFAPPNATHTGFSGNLIDVLDRGLPNDSATLGLNEIFREVARRCRRQGLPEPQMLPALTEIDVAFARNPRYFREPAVEDSFITLHSEVDRWIRQLRKASGVEVSARQANELRELLRGFYAHRDRVEIQIETDDTSDWSAEALESCTASAHALEDALRRLHAASRVASKRRRDALRGDAGALRRLDEDNAVAVEGRRRVSDALMELRTSLRELARMPDPR
jgi:hypothetical protein